LIDGGVLAHGYLLDILYFVCGILVGILIAEKARPR